MRHIHQRFKRRTVQELEQTCLCIHVRHGTQVSKWNLAERWWALAAAAAPRLVLTKRGAGCFRDKWFPGMLPWDSWSFIAGCFWDRRWFRNGWLPRRGVKGFV